ncbi:MAG: hypothetical protein AB7R90_20785 [Reyranellaceae bacterium]
MTGRLHELAKAAAAAVAALAIIASHAPALAQSQPQQPSAAGKKAEPLPEPVTAEVTGFRSARFGMTIEQVQDAIRQDFGVAAKDIGRLRNELQKTEALSVDIDDLVPGSGRATVFYLFGYASKKLIHVNVVWGRQARHDAAPATLVNTGRILQQYFLGQGFAREGRLVNKAADGGQIVLFQGFDDKKRAVQLTLEMSEVPVAKQADARQGGGKSPSKADAARPGEKQTVASSLRLSYIENVTNPDIYRIPKGKF